MTKEQINSLYEKRNKLLAEVKVIDNTLKSAVSELNGQIKSTEAEKLQLGDWLDENEETLMPVIYDTLNEKYNELVKKLMMLKVLRRQYK